MASLVDMFRALYTTGRIVLLDPSWARLLAPQLPSHCDFLDTPPSAPSFLCTSLSTQCRLCSPRRFLRSVSISANCSAVLSSHIPLTCLYILPILLYLRFHCFHVILSLPRARSLYLILSSLATPSSSFLPPHNRAHFCRPLVKLNVISPLSRPGPGVRVHIVNRQVK